MRKRLKEGEVAMPSTRLSKRKGEMLPGQMASVLTAHRSGSNMEGMLWKKSHVGFSKGILQIPGREENKKVRWRVLTVSIKG